MRKNKIPGFIFFFSILLFSYSLIPVFAEPIVTLDEAYRSAISRSEQIRIVQEGVAQAREEARRARSALFPNLSSELSYLRRPRTKETSQFILRPESESQMTVTLAQPLYSGGRAMSGYRSANLGIEEEGLNLVLTREDLLFEIARAYYEALKAKNNVKIETKERERLQEHRRSAEKRFQVGEVTKMVLLRAEAELSNAQANLIRAQNDEIAMKDQLALLARIEDPFDLVDPPPVSFPVRAIGDWIDRSHENRIELKQGEININQTKEGVVFARGNFLPYLSLDLEYRWIDQDPKGDFLIQNDPLAILKLTVPIFEGMLRRAELAQARSQLRQAALTQKKLKNEIDVAVRRSILNLSTLTGELEHLQDRVRFAREAFTLASRQFDVGLGTHIDVLDANSALLDAERRLSNTVYDRELAILQLKKNSGLYSPLRNQNPEE